MRRRQTAGLARRVRLVALTVLLALPPATATHAQSPFSFDFHGFVNPHYYADSRAVVGGREDMMLFYPKPMALDSAGHDVNEGWQANMLAITARIGLKISGPDMLGARTSAYLEGDFTGATNATINNLRLRHAYITLDWGRHRLLAGQYWYPMVFPEAMPMTNPLNMGSPFLCYARQPQVRYTLVLGSVEAAATALWQLDNMSQGLLDGQRASSTLFARHSLLPELNLALRWRTSLGADGNLLLGAAANLKTIQPQVLLDSVFSQPLPSDKHSSFTLALFGRADIGPVSIKAQTLLGNSLYEGCSLGGYLLLDDGSYRDWHFNSVGLDLSRRRGHWQPGLFFGYAHNLDYGNTDYLQCFGRAHDIRTLWRVQPRLTYSTLNGLDFTAEAEYTSADYPTGTVGNLRLSLSMVYAF